jgi:molybdate transport system substrate-binding protein
VLAWVETGNADAGMVYETDAKTSDRVKVAAAAPDGAYKPITYPAAVIKASKNKDQAGEFLNFLSGTRPGRYLKSTGLCSCPSKEDCCNG